MFEEKTVEIPVSRYTDLLRKEVGFEYRRAELNEKEYKWLTIPDRVIFGATGKGEVPIPCDDDF